MKLGSAIAFGAATLWLGAAHAGPAEELAAFLDSMQPGLGYRSIEATEDGGVTVQGLTATVAFLAESGALVPPTGDAGDATALTVESLRLSEGAAAMLVGTNSGAEPGTIVIDATGVHLDLAVMAGSRRVDLLREHLGTDQIDGQIAIAVEQGADGQHAARIDAGSDQVGQIALVLAFDETGGQLLSGEAWLADTPRRGLVGLGAYLHRLGGVRDAMRAELDAMPSTGPAAAAALADWAAGMAAALPEHAPVLEAAAAFASEPGRLHVTFAQPDPAGDVYEGLSGSGFAQDPQQVSDLIEGLGLGAEFAPAE